MAESLYPPHSRLYVNCDRETTEEELQVAFQPYGSVVNINVCKDVKTGQKKGFAFIQYERTSEAAAAMEGLDGSMIGNSYRPLKITVALPKDQNSNDPTQFLRLFLCIPKTATEVDLSKYFRQFGEIDTISIVRNRQTKENKGFAYIKFKRFLDAAHAFENCDHSYRVVFAKPKDQANNRFLFEGPNSGPASDVANACTHIDDNPEGYTSLRALVSMELNDDQIEWLFDIPPGLEYVRFFNEPPLLNYDGTYSRKVVVQYDGPGTAAYALRKLNNCEFPAGSKVQLQPNFDVSDRIAQRNRKMGGATGKAATRPGQTSDLMNEVESLTHTLNEAMRLLNHNGIGGHLKTRLREIEASRCSVQLPPPKPLAPLTSQTAERLFLVCEPGLPPQDTLWDVFGRFGNLIELYILNGKNCGYARYADKYSAQKAMQTLNDQYLYRMKMRVMIAEPIKEDRKRLRANY